MRKYLLILACLFAFQGIFPQAESSKDPEAKKIMDKLSARARKDFPIQVAFEYIYEDLMDQQKDTRKGTLILDEKRFRLSLEEAVVISDGITVWNHLTSANEVYISDAEEEGMQDDFFISNPSDLFTFYKEGFKYRLKGEIEIKMKIYEEIDIFPEDLDKNYHTVKLLIDKKDQLLYSAQAYGKAGVNHTVILTEYRAKAKTDEHTFIFNPADHPGVEAIDTRF